MEDPTAPENGHGAGTPSGEANGTGDVGDAQNAGGAGEGSGSWLETIPAELTYEVEVDGKPQAVPLRDHPKIKGFKDIGELVKSFHEQEKMLGKKTIGLVPLKENATDEERKAHDQELRRILNVPEKAEDYDLKLPDGTPVDEGFKGWFLQSALKNGFSPTQVNGMAGDYMEWAKDYWAGEIKKGEEAKAAAAKEATEIFGGESKATEAVELAKRGFLNVAERAGIEPEKAEAWSKTYGDDLTFVRLFHFIGKNTSQEHGFADGSGAPGTKEKTRREQYEAQFPKS